MGKLMERYQNGENDPLFTEAVERVVGENHASIAGVQRYFKISYRRAGTIVEAMEGQGVCSGPDERGHREVLIEALEQWNPVAARGRQVEHLGKIMQRRSATIEDLAKAAIAAGLNLRFAISVDDDEAA